MIKIESVAKFKIIINKEKQLVVRFDRLSKDIDLVDSVDFEVDFENRVLLVKYEFRNKEINRFIFKNIKLKDLKMIAKNSVIYIIEDSDLDTNSFYYPVINEIVL